MSSFRRRFDSCNLGRQRSIPGISKSIFSQEQHAVTLRFANTTLQNRYRVNGTSTPFGNHEIAMPPNCPFSHTKMVTILNMRTIQYNFTTWMVIIVFAASLLVIKRHESFFLFVSYVLKRIQNCLSRWWMAVTTSCLYYI